MAKHNKKRQTVTTAHPQRRPPTQQHVHSEKQKKTQQQAQLRPIVPFEAGDDLLLVGEGDFSFAHSLLLHHPHGFRSLIATTFESRDELLKKYPQSEGYIETLLAANTEPRTPERHSISDDQNTPSEDDTSDTEFHGFSDAPSASEEDGSSNGHENTSSNPSTSSTHPRCTILYSVDATRLGKTPGLRPSHHPGRFDRIVFNFPHVGGKASGKSTDVNRQVRHNQQLLHSFFGECKGYLKRRRGRQEHGGGGEGSSSSVLVTLFEGEPYTLWNVRDLARSAGLVGRRSWAFDWGLYPGYGHARTLGNLRRRAGDEGEGGGEEILESENPSKGRDKGKVKVKGKGGWKGEERSARTYEFGLKEEAIRGPGKKKRKRGTDDSSSDED